jgi:hypothetical protein
MLNMKPVCGSVRVSDVAADTGFSSGVHPQPIATGFAPDVDPSFVEPKYEAAFRDEHAEDSADDRSVP